MSFQRRMTMVTSLSVLLAFACRPAPAERPCPPDLDCNGDVAVNDLLELLADWGEAGTTTDIDGSGAVDIGDLLLMLATWGPCVFDFETPFDDPEAEQIALEMLGPTGALLPDEADYERIVRDLGLIRDAFPLLEPEIHTLAWAPNRLIVQILHGVPLDEYVCLNAFYGVTDETFLFSFGGADWYVITLGGNVNVEGLATIYAATPEIGIAEPDALLGGSNFWVPSAGPSDTWQWDIEDGWHDCFDGCDCFRVYVIKTTAEGDVILVSFEEFGAPWCDFKQ